MIVRASFFLESNPKAGLGFCLLQFAFLVAE